MYYTPKPLLTFAIVICTSFNAWSQTDTTAPDLNLGRVKLKKDFTQSITIKGEQLEKMPFTSLYEAINAWSYGYYAGRGNIVYVIDGIVVNDVNAYSVYDIQEVTLVQNALIQVSGAIRQQQLALVTTRKGGPGKQGMVVAGQSFLVRGDNVSSPLNNNTATETNYFHQYQISAYQKGKNIQYGVSANYLRDVSPAIKEPNYKTNVPNNSDRFRINGWLSAKLGNAHELSIRVNVTPQISDYERSFANYLPGNTLTGYNKQHIKQTLFNPTIGLQSRLGAGFTNEFTASYGSSKVKGKNQGEVTYPASHLFQTMNSTLKLQQVLLMDQVSYHASLGNNWSVEPSLNFMFRYLKNDNEYLQASRTNGNITSTNSSTFNQEGRIFLLTPSLNLYYRNSFNIQGGLIANLSKTYGQEVRKALPFITTSVDVLRLANPLNATSLKFFGSLAQADNLGDLSLNLDNPAASTPFHFFGPIGTAPIPSGLAPDNSFWIWQTGSRLGILNDLVTVNYFFERRNFTAEVFVQMPSSNYIIVYPDITSSTHHLDINATVFNKNSIYWRTGLNATSIKSKTDKDPGFYTAHTVLGDLNSDKTSWTGGWINRFSWNQFKAGLDLVYYFNPDQLPTIPGDSKVDAISLQNVYVGYQLNLKGTTGLELYADCRNLKQDKDFKITGNKKYYGLGIKAIL